MKKFAEFLKKHIWKLLSVLLLAALVIQNIFFARAQNLSEQRIDNLLHAPMFSSSIAVPLPYKAYSAVEGDGHMLITLNKPNFKTSGIYYRNADIVPGQYIVTHEAFVYDRAVHNPTQTVPESHYYIDQFKVNIYNIKSPNSLVKTLDLKKIMETHTPGRVARNSVAGITKYNGVYCVATYLQWDGFSEIAEEDKGTPMAGYLIVVEIESEAVHVAPSWELREHEESYSTKLPDPGNLLSGYADMDSLLAKNGIPFSATNIDGVPTLEACRLTLTNRAALKGYDSGLTDMFPKLLSLAQAMESHDQMEIYLYGIESLEQLLELLMPRSEGAEEAA